MLNLWNFRNWQFTVYSSVSTMQSARCLSILSSAWSVLLHMVLYSIWIREWMTEPTDCRGKGRKTWRGVYSTNFIQFQPHHLHIYVESGISRWRNTSGVAPSTFTGADSVIFSDFVRSKYRCPRHLLSGPENCFLRLVLSPRCIYIYIYKSQNYGFPQKVNKTNPIRIVFIVLIDSAYFPWVMIVRV